ncbi:MAG: PAS domain-containing protein, partial [Actinomycetota bacterium]
MGATERRTAAVIDDRDPSALLDDVSLRLVVESFPGGGIALFDDEMRFVIAGGRGVDLVGLDPDRLRGKTPSASMPPETAAALEPRFAAALEGRSSTFDLAFGELVLKIRVAPLEADGAILGGLVSALDVTASRAKSAQLHATEEQYRALAEASPDLIGRYGRDERLAYVNAAIEQANGVDRRDIIGRRITELGDPPELVALWQSALRRTIATGEPQVVRYPFPTPDGPRWHESRHIPEFGPDGEVTHVTFTARDIHELKTSRDAITARLAQQEAVGELANGALAATDVDALLTEATRTVSAVLAVPLVEVLERQPDDAGFLLRAGLG